MLRELFMWNTSSIELLCEIIEVEEDPVLYIDVEREPTFVCKLVMLKKFRSLKDFFNSFSWKSCSWNSAGARPKVTVSDPCPLTPLVLTARREILGTQSPGSPRRE